MVDVNATIRVKSIKPDRVAFAQLCESEGDMYTVFRPLNRDAVSCFISQVLVTNWAGK